MNAGARRWWKRPWRVVAMAVLLLALLGAVGFWGASKTGLKRELAAIRAKGLPTTPAELDVWYAKVPTEENGALKVMEAHGEYVEAREGRDPGEISWSEIPQDRPLDGTTMAVLRFHAERNSKALEILREGAKLERSRYPMDLSGAPDVLFPHLLQAKRLAQLARWEAVYQAELGDAAAALEALRCGFFVSRTLGREPLLISELVRLACASIQLVGMERVVNVVKFDEEQLEELIGMVREAGEESRTALNRAFIGERAFANSGRKYSFEEYEQMTGVGAFVGMMIGGGGVTPGNAGDEWPEFVRRGLYYGRRGIGMQDRDHAFYMRSMGRLIEATAPENPRFVEEFERVSAELSAELNEHPIALALSRISLASMFGVTKREALLIARLRCAEAVLRIELWRRKHEGVLPKEGELVGASGVFERMPTDPFDGAPLKYEMIERGERGEEVGENKGKTGRGYRVVAVTATEKEYQGRTPISGKARRVAFEVLR